MGGIFKTTNSGVSWYQVNSGTTSSLRDVLFKDNLNGVIIANYDLPIITNDGGETWAKINYNFGGLNSGVFFGRNNIALVGQSGKIFISKDDGLSWEEKVVTSPGHYISSIAFKDSLNGTAVGETGIMFNTTDGGENWQTQFSPTLIDFLKIKYSKNGNGIILGKEGVILGSKSGFISGFDLNEISTSPKEFYLSQNFPNPLNPSTTIKYSIPKSSQVTLKIFNTLGQEIEALVNEEKPVGTYELTWNAANLPSGVYFYQLYAGKFIKTKKMILLR